MSKEMLEVVSNYDQEIKFIVGFAGSGKSTRLATEANEKTLVLTPTHKAASVLQRKGVKNVYTIHSALKLVPTINENYRPGKQKMQSLKRIGNTDLNAITDIFIDEFSMIPQNILDLLLEVLPSEAKVTIFGDPYQLPPVSGYCIYPYLYTNEVEELTTQHRADAPEVVETFMRFMTYLKNGSELDLKLNPKIQKGTLKDFNPDTDRALAFTNKKVSELNTTIASILKLPEEYSIGEDLIANQIECTLSDALPECNIYPTCISKGKLMEGEKLDTTILKTENDIVKYNTSIPYPTCYINIDDRVFKVYYDINHYRTQQQLKADIDKYQALVYQHNDIPKNVMLKEFCVANRDAKYVKERGKAWQAFMTHSNLVFNLQRPFATTIHKSQGSEFSTVYIAQDDIKIAIKPNYYEQYARLMYVALSRAINKVIII